MSNCHSHSDYCVSLGYCGVWDQECMGKMVLSLDKKTVTHGGDFLGSYQCVRGTVPITSGVYYWEILIDKLRYFLLCSPLFAVSY